MNAREAYAYARLHPTLPVPPALGPLMSALLSASGTRERNSPRQRRRGRRRTQHRVLLGQAVRDADDVKRYGANRHCLMQGGPTGKMVVLVSTHGIPASLPVVFGNG